MPHLEIVRYGKPPSWLTRVSEFVRSITLGPFNPKDRVLAQLFGGAPVSSGVSVNENAALATSAFWSAVTLIAGDVASLPLLLYKRMPNGGKERFTGHPLYRILHDEPNTEMGSMQFRETWVLDALINGNGYAEIERDGTGRPRYLWPIQSHRISVIHENDRLSYRLQNYTRGDITLEPRDILHLRGPSPDGLSGYNMVRIAREALGLAIAAERFGGSFFGNGMTFGGVVSYPHAKPLEKTEKNTQEVLERRHQGVDRAYKLLALYNGAKFEKVGVPPNEGQFNETRIFQIREIARFFRIPVAMLGDLERSTFSNHEQQTLAYFTSCLRPWLVRIEQELMTKLIAPMERSQQLIEHVTEGFLRADVEKRGAFYGQALAHGWMTVNEVRERENMAPIDGGDVARVPMNTEPLGSSDAA